MQRNQVEVENLLHFDNFEQQSMDPVDENQKIEPSESKIDKNLMPTDSKHLEPPVNEKCDESDDEWNYIQMKEGEGEKQETENSEKGIINSSADKLVIDQVSTEKDDIGENHEKNDNKSQNDILNQQNIDVINFDKIAATDDMNYQLNPDAKEFIPTSPPDFPALTNGYPKLQQRFEDEVVAQSPRKASINMEDIQVPEEDTFDKEAAERPHEVAEELIIPEQAPIPCGIRCGDENRHVCEELVYQQDIVLENDFEKENSISNAVITTANADPLVGFSPVAELDNIDMNRSIYIENSSSKTEKDESDLLNSVQTIPDEIENDNKSIEQRENNLLEISNAEIQGLNLDNIVENIEKLDLNAQENFPVIDQTGENDRHIQETNELLRQEQKENIEIPTKPEETIDIASAAVATAAVVAIKAVADKSKVTKPPTSAAPKVGEIKKSLQKTSTSATDTKRPSPTAKVPTAKSTSTATAKPKTINIAGIQPPKTITISPPKRPRTAPISSAGTNEKKPTSQITTKTNVRPQSVGLTKKVPVTTTFTTKTSSENSTLKTQTGKPPPVKNAAEARSAITKTSPSTLKSKTVKSPLNGVASTNVPPKTLLVNKTTSTTNKTSTFKAASPRTITSSAPTKTETNKSPITKTVTKTTSRPIASAPRTIGVTKKTTTTTTTSCKPSNKLESNATTVKKTVTSTVTSTVKKSTRPTAPLPPAKKTTSSATGKLSSSKVETNKSSGKTPEKKVESETQMINNEINNIPLEVQNTSNLNGDNFVTEIKDDICA